MYWNFRTFLRLFLVVGGTAFLLSGTIEGETVQIVLGAVALVLGAGGLAHERRETTTNN